jgi:predicted kinase
MQPTVYMLCGPVCSGKSTFAAENSILFDRVVFAEWNTDSYIEELAASSGKTYNEIFKDTIKTAERALAEWQKDSMELGMNIIWDQTNLTLKTRIRKMMIFQDTNYYRVGVFFVNATKDLIMSRNNRPGKIIPEHVIDSMLRTYELPKPDLEPFDNIIEVDAVTGKVLAGVM